MTTHTLVRRLVLDGTGPRSYTIKSYLLQQHIPNAQLILYPNAGHGSLYQYPERFVRHVSMFLSEDEGCLNVPFPFPRVSRA
jgi:hypothetical protein